MPCRRQAARFAQDDLGFGGCKQKVIIGAARDKLGGAFGLTSILFEEKRTASEVREGRLRGACNGRVRLGRRRECACREQNANKT
jgi:hypothetical protein